MPLPFQRIQKSQNMHQHKFSPHENSQYEQCEICQSLHSKVGFPREKYLQEYWSSLHGHSTIVEQRYNCERILNGKEESKIFSVLKYCVGDSILEVACAPGSFLRLAKINGYFALGIEPDHTYCTPISDYSGCDVSCGFFEDYKGISKFSNIVAMDLMEHLESPEEFIQHAFSLIEKGGRLVLMLPTIENMRPEDLHPEHMNIWSEQFLHEWLSPSIIEHWLPGHTIVVIDH